MNILLINIFFVGFMVYKIHIFVFGYFPLAIMFQFTVYIYSINKCNIIIKHIDRIQIID